MSIFKRISASFVASVDQVVSDIENNEAVVKASLDEQRRGVADAKLQLKRVQAEERLLQQRLTEAKVEVMRWEERAKSVAHSDEAKALQCLERRDNSQRQVDRLSIALTDFQANSARFTQQVEQSEIRLQTLMRKHSLMKARQATAKAQDVRSISGQNEVLELDAAFDRWESKITENELNSEPVDIPDALDQAFSEQEKQAKLRADLATLMNKE